MEEEEDGRGRGKGGRVRSEGKVEDDKRESVSILHLSCSSHPYHSFILNSRYIAVLHSHQFHLHFISSLPLTHVQL